MEIAVEAEYFDGITSALRKATVEYIASLDLLRFHGTEEPFSDWLLKDLKFEKFGHQLEIRNRKLPGVVVKIVYSTAGSVFFEAIQVEKRLDLHSRFLQLGMAKISLIAGILIACFVLAFFFVLPPLAENAATLLPDEFDDKIGDAFMGQLIVESRIDEERTKLLTEFASGLNLKNRKKLRFSVVKSEIVNAFALPNGQIVVFSGILARLKSEEELAALLGHEASHVNHRHSTKLLCRNLAGYMMVSLILNDINGVMAVIADNAQQLYSLSYSRKFEEEADQEGLKILMQNQINPQGMVHLFERLDEESTISLPEILSSHPLTRERKMNMQKKISEADSKVRTNERLKELFRRLTN